MNKQLFEFIKQILNNPEIKRKEMHDTPYFPTRYLCESELNDHVAPRWQASYKRKLSESGKILLRLTKELRESYHIEKGAQARITPIGAKKAIAEFE